MLSLPDVARPAPLLQIEERLGSLGIESGAGGLGSRRWSAYRAVWHDYEASAGAEARREICRRLR